MSSNNYGEIEERADWSLIPESMHGAMRAWVELGRKPGHFLTAVLENNLHGAVSRADSANMAAIKGWVTFVYNYCPAGCWGSPERVHRWMIDARDHFDHLAESHDADQQAERGYAETQQRPRA